jgi:hypothetical protein
MRAVVSIARLGLAEVGGLARGRLRRFQGQERRLSAHQGLRRQGQIHQGIRQAIPHLCAGQQNVTADVEWFGVIANDFPEERPVPTAKRQPRILGVSRRDSFAVEWSTVASQPSQRITV